MVSQRWPTSPDVGQRWDIISPTCEPLEFFYTRFWLLVRGFNGGRCSAEKRQFLVTAAQKHTAQKCTAHTEAYLLPISCWSLYLRVYTRRGQVRGVYHAGLPSRTGSNGAVLVEAIRSHPLYGPCESSGSYVTKKAGNTPISSATPDTCFTIKPLLNAPHVPSRQTREQTRFAKWSSDPLSPRFVWYFLVRHYWRMHVYNHACAIQWSRTSTMATLVIEHSYYRD